MSKIIGIDLGTSNTAAIAAVLREQSLNTPRVIRGGIPQETAEYTQAKKLAWVIARLAARRAVAGCGKIGTLWSSDNGGDVSAAEPVEVCGFSVLIEVRYTGGMAYRRCSASLQIMQEGSILPVWYEEFVPHGNWVDNGPSQGIITEPCEGPAMFDYIEHCLKEGGGEY